MSAQDPSSAGQDGHPAVAAYKEVLRDVLDKRPSGMRRRLAEALERNPSFISQIANPAYPTPIPVAHVETILEICHFSAAERTRFLAAYELAHPRRARRPAEARRHRTLSVRVPDFEDDKKNKAMEDLIHNLVARITKLVED